MNGSTERYGERASARVATVVAMAIALAWGLGAIACAPARAADSTPPAVSPAAGTEPAQPPAPAPAASRHARHRTERQLIDESVDRMTRSLNLDAAQQQRLRAVIEEEHRELWKLRTEPTSPDADRGGMIRAIFDRTRQQIRDLLTEEQRQKYPGVTPADVLGPAHTDLDRWLRPQPASAGSAPATAP
jgi:hypothetical protein